MRDCYQQTITQPQADGSLRALAGVQISVFLAGTNTLANIFQRRTGAAQGPAPEAAASGGPNPFTTGASGAVEFWAAAGVYDIAVQDTIVPARIAQRGGGVGTALQWNSAPMDTGSVPSAVLSSDAGLTLGSLGADILRQVHPIGEVIEWWRPSGAVPIPTGFEICDGRQIAAGQHDFVGVAGAINLPDLRNKFILGADPFKADGSGSANGDGTALSGVQHPNAPGIGGTGGANATKNLQHTHQHAHTHGVQGVDHLHSVGSYSGQGHYHQVTGGTGYESFGASYAGGGNQYTNSIATPHAHNFDVGSGGDSAHGITGASGAADRSLAQRTDTVGTNTISTTTTDNGTASAAADMRPAHFGLLKIMKVRRS